jgi:SNF2 family DNA or RNA helicase
VLELPEKIYKDIKITFPESKKYTLENVKNLVSDFVSERYEFYTNNRKRFEKDFDNCVSYLKTILSNDKDFSRWLKYINYLRKYRFSMSDQYIKENLEWANEYEKTILMDLLPKELKHKFKASKSVVKYVSLKILGEVLGGLLNKLRSEMYEKMIHYSPTCEIINNSEKKTIIYTTFVPIVKSLENYTKTKCGSKPITIYGETKNVPQNIVEFKNTDNNPLIATIQSLSTGVTLVEANTIIFINPPWRSTDKQQAEDRIHRIGQDSTVYIYNYTLDTGGEPNLSTRMDDIIDWSKSLFSAIMEPGEKMEMEKVSTMYKKLY